MNNLPAFSPYFRALWGYDPFPWQVRLSDQLASERWPEWVTLPTGMGKTTALDIAVYDLARQAHLPLGERTAPVRIVFAVNRRIVVDEAFARARLIAAKLSVSCGHRENHELPEDERIDEVQMAILRPIAVALRQLAGPTDGPPLEAFPLRGATFTDHSWARTPTQPLILTTTLDQLGSRLLFRGYGVSTGARPIHAALLANDALLILDEAHTAKAFSQTLSGIARLRKDGIDSLPLPFAAVQLTATPPTSLSEEPFSLIATDHAHPLIHQRYQASKPAQFHEVEGAKGAARHSKLAEAMAETALSFLSAGNRRVLIVVNRVATAEALLKKLTPSRQSDDHGAAVKLLTGRLRPLDRDALISDLNDRHQLKSSSPSPDVDPLILISTQSIEVGADFDFDALVTELSPLDSLRQRFGRLNRQGRSIPAPAAIFAPEEALDENKDDPIYGSCLPFVWKWLRGSIDEDGEVDFGLSAMRSVMPTGDELDALLAPSADAPLLLRSHLDLFCQTSPEPHIPPDPSLYIHGPSKNFPEVSVVLRADLGELKSALEILAATPPLGTEAATLPIHLVRQWLDNPDKVKDESGDAPASPEAETKSKKAPTAGLIIWR